MAHNKRIIKNQRRFQAKAIDLSIARKILLIDFSITTAIITIYQITAYIIIIILYKTLIGGNIISARAW